MRSWWAGNTCFQWVRDLTEAIRIALVKVTLTAVRRAVLPSKESWRGE